MQKDKLTELTIKQAKPREKEYKLSDGGGLYLLVHPRGSRYWRFDFRFVGKQKSSSFFVPFFTRRLQYNKKVCFYFYYCQLLISTIIII